MSRDREGRCYELAAKYVLEHGGRSPDMYLCHGWPVLTGGEHVGTRYGHAWVERTTLVRIPLDGGGIGKLPMIECMDTVKKLWVPRVFFYRAGKIDPEHVTKYDWEDTMRNLDLQEVYGPWDGPPPYDSVAPFADGHLEPS